jgi:hypothetical protein
MKTTQIIASLAVGAAMVFATGKAQAQVLSKLTVSAKVSYQLNDTQKVQGNGSITTTYKYKTVTVNNSKMIALLNASGTFTNDAGGTIPGGSYFVIDGNSGDVIVTNKSGWSFNLTSNDSEDIFASFSQGDYSVYNGNSNNQSTQYKEKGLQAWTEFSFDDNAGNSFYIYGVANYSFSDGKANSSGVYTESTSGKVTGFGEGSTTASDAQNGDTVVQGSFKANGSAKLTQPS